MHGQTRENIQQQNRRKSFLILYCLIIILFTIIAFMSSIFLGVITFVLIPISFLFIAVFHLMSRYFWEAKKYCPRCNAPVSIYSEYCKNCGLKLINKCPRCGRFSKVGFPSCNNCGFAFFTAEELELEPKIANELYISKGSSPPKKPNFCPNCGLELKPDQQNLRYCERCGGKLDT